MILEIGKKYSRFYSVWEDSIIRVRKEKFAQGMSMEEYRKSIQGLPRSYQFYEVEKFMDRKIISFSDRPLTEYYRYEETMERPAWKMEASQEMIAGYHCQKASARFRGRDWTVWFTPEIPLSDGPWKLWGLPGLILKAEESEKQFSFICIGIQQYDPPKIMRKRIENPVKCTAAAYKKLMEEYSKDFNSLLFKELGYREPVQPGQKTNKFIYNPMER